MEKVKSCTFKQDYVKDGETKKIYTIETESGLTGQSWGELPIGADVNYTEGKEYKGVKQLTFKLAGDKKNFPAKDWGTPKRICALESALKYTELMPDKSKMTADNVIVLAEKFLSFLNK